MRRWLIFLPETGAGAWLRIDDAEVTARGVGLPVIAGDPADCEIIAVVPGAAVVMHWVELPALAPAQALAAARLLAADVAGTPIAATHVTLGTADAAGFRPLAMVDKAVMSGWLVTLAQAAINPDRLVPLPLLLPFDDSADAAVTVLTVGDTAQVRGHRLAFAAEASLVEFMLPERGQVAIDQRRFEAGLSAALAAMPLDLRQGEFAVSRRQPIDPRRVRRIAALAAGAALLWLVGEAAGIFRDGLAADRAEAQLADAARAVLPRGTAIDAPRAQVAAHAARLGGSGQGFSALAAPLLALMRDRPATALQALRYAPDTGLVAVVGAPSAADGAAVADGLAAAGLKATIGVPRDDAGSAVVDIAVRPR